MRIEFYYDSFDFYFLVYKDGKVHKLIVSKKRLGDFLLENEDEFIFSPSKKTEKSFENWK